MFPVLDFIHTQPRPLRRRAEAVPGDSVHQRAAGSTPPTCKRCAEWTADEMRRIGLENVRLDRDAGQPGRLRRLAARARARRRSSSTATTTCSRSIRVESVGVAAVRGDGARRRDLRARRRRRQGPGVHALQGDRGAPEAGRHAAGQHQAHHRGRGGSRLASTSTTSSAPTSRMLAADVVVISDSAMFDRGVPSICYSLRGLVYFQIDLRGTKSDLHSGVVRRRRREPGHGARADPRADEGPRRPHQDSRLLRRRARRCREEERDAVEEAAVQREAVPQGSRRAEAVRRDAATRRSSACGRGRRSRSTACSAASPARAPRP